LRQFKEQRGLADLPRAGKKLNSSGRWLRQPSREGCAAFLVIHGLMILE